MRQPSACRLCGAGEELRNDVLLRKAQRVRGKAAMAMIETGQLVRAYGDFHHITKSRTWARPRRVIAKVEHKPGHEQRCRFLVTSLDRHQVPPRELYEDAYCPRGDMENHIKDCQLDLFANRMSAHEKHTLRRARDSRISAPLVIAILF